MIGAAGCELENEVEIGVKACCRGHIVEEFCSKVCADDRGSPARDRGIGDHVHIEHRANLRSRVNLLGDPFSRTVEPSFFPCKPRVDDG